MVTREEEVKLMVAGGTALRKALVEANARLAEYEKLIPWRDNDAIQLRERYVITGEALAQLTAQGNK